MDYSFEFIGAINDENIGSLINFIKSNAANITKLTININSTGGSVNSGICIYNFLKNVNFELVTHNIGETSSAAVLLFLSGKVRTAEYTSKFILHSITMGLNGDFSYCKTNELLCSLDADIKNYASIVRTETNNLNEIYDIDRILRGESVVLNKQQAFECSILTCQ